MNTGRTAHDRDALASELAERCAQLLSPQDWEHVSNALGEMHDQLREDIPDELAFDAVFADIVANLIDRLGRPPVRSWDQARIYKTSANSTHRAMATAWITLRQH
jgi:hypothetical protein